MKPQQTALVLQGGGALGAYQAGVFEALAEVGNVPDWIAGISIGAINAAIIAGNPPGDRVAQLRAFWERVSSNVLLAPLAESGPLRRAFNEASANVTATLGAPGFFTPRFPARWFSTPGSAAALSLYDSTPLRDTLLELVDFDRINRGDMRISLGAVHVTSGNFVYFDNLACTIGPEHVMASGALPPGFPPVWIDGEAYWDGGIVSNTPLQHVLDNRRQADHWTIYQVDLFPARGRMPDDVAEAVQREKDIRFSSRTRLNTDLNKEIVCLREAARRLVAKLPAELRDDPDARFLIRNSKAGSVSIMHLINRGEDYENHSKDYEFSRATMTGHWQNGHDDARLSLADPRWIDRRPDDLGFSVFDLFSTAESQDEAMETHA